MQVLGGSVPGRAQLGQVPAAGLCPGDSGEASVAGAEGGRWGGEDGVRRLQVAAMLATPGLVPSLLDP